MNFIRIPVNSAHHCTIQVARVADRNSILRLIHGNSHPVAPNTHQLLRELTLAEDERYNGHNCDGENRHHRNDNAVQDFHRVGNLCIQIGQCSDLGIHNTIHIVIALWFGANISLFTNKSAYVNFDHFVYPLPLSVETIPQNASD